MKKVIFHVDDFGLFESDVKIVESFDLGFITSVSVVMNACTEFKLNLLKERRVPTGVHLTSEFSLGSAEIEKSWISQIEKP